MEKMIFLFFSYIYMNSYINYQNTKINFNFSKTIVSMVDRGV